MGSMVAVLAAAQGLPPQRTQSYMCRGGWVGRASHEWEVSGLISLNEEEYGVDNKICTRVDGSVHFRLQDLKC